MTNLKNNLILFTDSYKHAHYQQYPPNTQKVFSYIESRGSSITDRVMVFGLQYFIKNYLTKPVTKEDIEQAAMLLTAHGLEFNRTGWEYIVEKHNGILPVRIRTVREGSVIPTHNVLLTIENTDPECFWLTSFLETALLQNFWYGSTVASNSFLAKQYIYDALVKSSDNPDSEIDFKLHCFGFRGVSSLESASIGNCAHLVNFKGTDTLAGITCAMENYYADVCGFSISASEHSTMTSWGETDEADAYINMVNTYAKPGAMFACVIDSYDTFNAIDMWSKNPKLLSAVKSGGATVVLRPDSGDPLTMPIEVIKRLMEVEGYTINSKGYKVLPNHVRVIQGDGITINSIPLIIENLLKEGLSMSNLAFGMGAGTLQKVDRDSYKYAMKCSSITVNGVQSDVFKNPKTDASKVSKRGELTLVMDDAGYHTIRIEDVAEHQNDEMVLAYENGIIELYFETFDVIRSRANSFIRK